MHDTGDGRVLLWTAEGSGRVAEKDKSATYIGRRWVFFPRIWTLYARISVFITGVRSPTINFLLRCSRTSMRIRFPFAFQLQLHPIGCALSITSTSRLSLHYLSCEAIFRKVFADLCSSASLTLIAALQPAGYGAASQSCAK